MKSQLIPASRLETQQKLTKDLQESLQILQFNNLELAEYLALNVEANPFITLELPETLSLPDRQDTDKTQEETNLTSEFNEHFASAYNPDKHQQWIEQQAATTSLRGKILEQISLNFPNPNHQKLAILISDYLNEDGYLLHSLNDIAIELGIELKEVQEIHNTLLKFEPTGIFSRNIGECLWLQLEEMELANEVTKVITQNLEYIALGKFNTLARMSKVEQKEIEQYIQIIKNLNPRPALGIATPPALGLPDLKLLKTDDGGYRVELYHISTPKITIEKNYYNQLTSSRLAQDEITYIKQQFKQATNLERAVKQRELTLLRIAQFIVEYQQDMLNYGPRYQQPLGLEFIAKNTHLHISTISRVISGKVLEYNGKIIMLKSLLSHKVEAGVSLAANSIKDSLRRIINEEKMQTYADEELAEKLSQQGIKISRRTVAKYRDQLGIPGKAERQKAKRMALMASAE